MGNLGQEILKLIETKEVRKSGKSGAVYLSKYLIGKKVGVILDVEKFRKILNQVIQECSKYKTIVSILSDVLNCCESRKMFSLVTRTWNPVTGCTHNCKYCWARRLAETRLRHIERYRHGFKPRLNIEEFNKEFKPGEFVFVSDMGDLFCQRVPDEWIRKVIEHIRKYPKTHFLFLTKNPKRYKDFINEFPPNVILGATIETNRDDLYEEYDISDAPLPSQRYKAMKSISWPKKFISIEPILDFDFEVFTNWIKEINPIIVYIGYDNYNNRLPEPPLKKTLELIEKLSEFTLVMKKTIRRAWYEIYA